MAADRRGTALVSDSLRRVASFAGAFAILCVSFGGYVGRFSPINRWQAGNYDPADYRYVAEYFWGVPIVPETYDAIWNGPWGTYLQTVPFRTIGLGTFYLLTGWLRLGHVPQTPDEVLAAGLAFVVVQKILLAVALLTLFAAVRRHWGAPLGFVALFLTAFPSDIWRISDDFLTEPPHRILFLLAAAFAVGMGARRHASAGPAIALTGVWLLATHLKVQWYVGAVLLLPVLLFQLWRDRASKGILVVVALATAAVPLSVIAVNWIGWRTTAMNPGIGLHLNLRYDEAILREFSAETEGDATRPPFADLAKPRLRWWLIHVTPETTQAQYEVFDRFAQRYMRARPASVLEHFWEGLTLASSFPGIERGNRGIIRLEPLHQPWRTLVRVGDVLVWALLLAGLAVDRTRVLCALSIVLWIVPALGNIASHYELRYHLPMAGIAATGASLVLTTLVRARRAA